MKKIKMIKNLFSFSLQLIFLLLAVFGLHQAVLSYLERSWLENLIVPSYITNYLLVLLTYAIIVYMKDKKSQSIGFIFLGGFFLKMAVFMIFFNPFYKLDGESSTGEFCAFFIPYGICLTFETIVLVRLLNRS